MNKTVRHRAFYIVRDSIFKQESLGLWLRPWTLADVLASRGYETAGLSSNVVYGYSGWGMRQGFEMYDDDSRSIEHNLAKTRVAQGVVLPLYRSFVGKNYFERRSAGELNRDVAGWLRHRSSHPYFLFINYFDVHSPYFAPPGYDRRFGWISRDLLDRWLAKSRVPDPSPFGPDDQRSVVGSYDNCVFYLGEQVGKLADMVAHTRDAANTIFIITSDHGEAFGEHGAYGHGWDLHREVVRVPLIIIGPGIPAGVKISTVVSTQELFSLGTGYGMERKIAIPYYELEPVLVSGFFTWPFRWRSRLRVGQLCF